MRAHGYGLTGKMTGGGLHSVAWASAITLDSTSVIALGQQLWGNICPLAQRPSTEQPICRRLRLHFVTKGALTFNFMSVTFRLSRVQICFARWIDSRLSTSACLQFPGSLIYILVLVPVRVPRTVYPLYR